jgi:hypothetical protein
MRKLKQKQKVRQIRLNQRRAVRRKARMTRKGLFRPKAQNKKESIDTYKQSDSGTKMHPIENRRDPGQGSIRRTRGRHG